MAFVSMTRLRVRSIFFLLPFMRANEASVKSLKQMKGCLGGMELVDKGLTFWTLTLWEDETAMKQFRNGNAHRAAMRNLPHWCDEASYHHWTQEEIILPNWQEASTKLIQEGKLTKVKNPSAEQLTGAFPNIKWERFERKIKS